MNSWLYILLAIILEVVATTCMKLSEGFSKILPSILMFVFYGICFTILTLALKKIELGVVYAVWSGLGTVLITAIGIFWLNESASPGKIGAILLIIVGVVILKLNPESVIVQEEGILSGEGAGIGNLETTQPVKTQDMLPPAQDSAFLMPQMPIKSPDLEKVPIRGAEQRRNPAED
jgi:small multidrug resistance pump